MRKKAEDARQPFQFEWEVPEAGYRWERGSPRDNQLRETAKPEPMLVEHPLGVSRMGKRYRTLRKATGLFITFGDINPTPEGILTFANQYGALGGTFSKNVFVEKALHTGEPISAWRLEIAALRPLLALWDSKRKSEITFRTAPESIFAEWASGFSSKVVIRPLDPDTYERLKNKTAEIAQHYLRTQVNAKLLQHPTTTRLIYDKALGRDTLYIVPTSLIAAIWLQFASAIDGNRQYRSCKNCGKWFEVGGSARRADAEVCSDSCRAAFTYREKQRLKDQQKRKRGRK